MVKAILLLVVLWLTPTPFFSTQSNPDNGIALSGALDDTEPQKDSGGN
jgi:hypothetical protein